MASIRRILRVPSGVVSSHGLAENPREHHAGIFDLLRPTSWVAGLAGLPASVKRRPAAADLMGLVLIRGIGHHAVSRDIARAARICSKVRPDSTCTACLPVNVWKRRMATST